MDGSRIKDLLRAAGGAALATVLPLKVVNSVLGVISAVLPDETQAQLDPTKVTGNELLDLISQLPVEVQTTVLERRFDLEKQVMEAELELTQNLADADRKGKSFRPSIALMMALLLAGNTIMYCVMLWKICMTADVPRMPVWDELVIPIGMPFLIVVTYFGFMKKERGELVQALLQNSRAGNVASGVAQKVLDLAQQSNQKR